MSQSGYAPFGIVSSKNVYKKQKNSIQNILVAEITIKQVFIWEEFESEKAMKNSFAVMKGKIRSLHSKCPTIAFYEWACGPF